VTSFLITCCHATCAIPEAQRNLFAGAEDIVTSTVGWEPGALNLAQGLAMKLSTPLIYGEVSRLLINLEENGDNQWSDYSRKIPEPSRARLQQRHIEKFHHTIEAQIKQFSKNSHILLHLDIHTAPITDGTVIYEFSGDPIAESFSNNAANLFLANEAKITSQPLSPPSPLIEWILSLETPAKLGSLRITVSQSFFLRSIPLRWETLKKGLISALYHAIPT
jgi:hypothetical protein